MKKKTGRQAAKRGLKNARVRTINADKARNVRGGQGDLKKGGSGGGGGGKGL